MRFDCIAGWFCSNLPKETIIMLLGRDHVNGRSAGVTSVEAFLGGHLDIPHNPREREGLYEVFDSMDFDGKLSRGLCVFFFVWRLSNDKWNINWVVPLSNNSYHQDYHTFSRGSL